MNALKRFWYYLFGPNVHRIHKTRDGLERSYDYKSNSLEQKSQKALNFMTTSKYILYYTTPLWATVLYRRGYYTVGNALFFLKYAGWCSMLLLGVLIIRALGRSQNQEYVTFLSVWRAAINNPRSYEARNRLRAYTIDFKCWPVDFRFDDHEIYKCRPKPVSVWKRVNSQYPNFMVSLFYGMPKELVGYMVAHTLGISLVYPGSMMLLQAAFGTDENVITFILANRSREQRHVIAQTYLEKYNKNLVEMLDSDLSGNYKITIEFLMYKKNEINARAIRRSIKGLGTDEDLLIEILCSMSSKDIIQLKMDYSMIFEGRNIEKDVEKDTSGKFKTLLLAILKANRPADTGTVSASKAEEDAKALLSMKVKNWSPLNAKFVEIFTERTFQHIRYMFKTSWGKLSKDDIMHKVDKDCSGDLKNGIKTLIRYSTSSTPTFYALELHEAMKGLGTADNQLVHIITTRSELDMVDIKEEYQRLYKEALSKRVANETSGDYKKILLSLLA